MQSSDYLEKMLGILSGSFDIYRPVAINAKEYPAYGYFSKFPFNLSSGSSSTVSPYLWPDTQGTGWLGSTLGQLVAQAPSASWSVL